MNNSRRAFTQAAHRAQSHHGSAQAYQLRLAEGFLDRVTVNRIPHSWQRQQVRPIANTELDQRALLKLIDEKTFGFADYRGNRQYLTMPNLSESDLFCSIPRAVSAPSFGVGPV